MQTLAELLKTLDKNFSVEQKATMNAAMGNKKDLTIAIENVKDEDTLINGLAAVVDKMDAKKMLNDLLKKHGLEHLIDHNSTTS